MKSIREKLTKRIARWLSRKDFPRTQMMIILLFTGVCAFLFSYFLLAFNVNSMWLRYPIVVFLSYIIFLLCLRIWIKVRIDEERQQAIDDMSDGVDGVNHIPSDGPVDMSIDDPGLGEEASSLISGDESIFVIILLIAVFAGIIICIHVIWTAPVLFAELILDVVILNRFYKRVKKNYNADWLSPAIRLTWVRATLLGVLLSIAGFCMQHLEPKANSVGSFIRLFLEDHPEKSEKNP